MPDEEAERLVREAKLLEAKRLVLVHNEQVKLLATFMNTVSAGTFIAGLLTPFAAAFLNRVDVLSFTRDHILYIAFWVVFGISLHAAAHLVLKGFRQ